MAVVRGMISLILFAAFGLGALVISPVVLVLGRRERGQPVVRAAWRLALFLFEATRLIRVEGRDNLASIEGSVVVANHPSLIDVVIIVALVPKTLYVAKHGLRSNPFLAGIVRATALPDDASLIGKAKPMLAHGWNVLVFPEGTRTGNSGIMGPFRRGAAQLALRTGSPVECIRIGVSRRILAKRQKPWDMGRETVCYAMERKTIPAKQAADSGIHGAAVELTARIRRELA